MGQYVQELNCYSVLHVLLCYVSDLSLLHVYNKLLIYCRCRPSQECDITANSQ